MWQFAFDSSGCLPECDHLSAYVFPGIISFSVGLVLFYIFNYIHIISHYA